MAIAFDTLAYANKLKAAGVSGEQAEVQAEALAGVIDETLATKRDIKELEGALKTDLKELETATKRDIKELEGVLKTDIKELEGTLKTDLKELEGVLKTDIKELELRLTVRLGGMTATAIAIVAILVKLL